MTVSEQTHTHGKSVTRRNEIIDHHHLTPEEIVKLRAMFEMAQATLEGRSTDSCVMAVRFDMSVPTWYVWIERVITLSVYLLRHPQPIGRPRKDIGADPDNIYAILRDQMRKVLR